MKIEFIKRGAATRLILIFAGWSTDARYYNDCVVDGWDTAVISDYRDISMPTVPHQYSTIYIFAYSLGVFAASKCSLPAAARIAVCGTPFPVSDRFGIPVDVYNATVENLNAQQLRKFHLRMAGGKSPYEEMKAKLSEYPDIAMLKEELTAISELQRVSLQKEPIPFDRIYIAEEDRIFPYRNMMAYWNTREDTVKICLRSSHAVDIAAVINDTIPDTAGIGEGFARAKATYSNAAVIQSEICAHIGDRLKNILKVSDGNKFSLLEIGVGEGLLTDIWRRLIIPDKATYIDLYEVPRFGIAAEERYVINDAEEWLKATDEKFDIILSASTIQWFVDPVGFIEVVRRHLNPDGVAIISTFVKGNLSELDKVRPCPIIYRTAEEYRSTGEFEMEEWERCLSFPSAKEMMMHLRKTGVTQKKGNERIIKKGNPGFSKGLMGLPCELTYRPLFIIIRG